MKTLFYEGLYGDNELVLVDQFIHVEAIAKRSRYYNWQVKVHAHHNLFQLFFVENGKGELLNDARKINFSGPCFLVIPAHTKHGFNFDSNVIGTVFTISESRLESLLKNEPDVIGLLSDMYVEKIESKDEHKAISILFRNCIKELNEGGFGRPLVLEYSISLILVYICRLLANKRGLNTTKDKGAKRIFTAFLQLLRKSSSTSSFKTVLEYADTLKITTNYLNRVCKQLSGRSCKDIILENALNEAKEHLLYSDLTISQVSDLVGFVDKNYFSRLFKRKTGMTPSDFRLNSRSLIGEELSDTSK